jgi:hypothetical protein
MTLPTCDIPAISTYFLRLNMGQRTPYPADCRFAHMGVNLSCFAAAVPEKFLDIAQISALFQAGGCIVQDSGQGFWSHAIKIRTPFVKSK